MNNQKEKKKKGSAFDISSQLACSVTAFMFSCSGAQ